MKGDSHARHGAMGLPANTSIAVGADGLYGWRGIAANPEAATRFAPVYRVTGVGRHCVIKVSEPLLRNQVYVAPQDYDFVCRFACGRCPKAGCVES